VSCTRWREGAAGVFASVPKTSAEKGRPHSAALPPLSSLVRRLGNEGRPTGCRAAGMDLIGGPLACSVGCLSLPLGRGELLAPVNLDVGLLGLFVQPLGPGVGLRTLLTGIQLVLAGRGAGPLDQLPVGALLGEALGHAKGAVRGLGLCQSPGSLLGTDQPGLPLPDLPVRQQPQRHGGVKFPCLRCRARPCGRSALGLFWRAHLGPLPSLGLRTTPTPTAPGNLPRPPRRGWRPWGAGQPPGGWPPGGRRGR
jgi:hypothetical protein